MTLATPAASRALPHGLTLRPVPADADELGDWLRLVATVFKNPRPVTPQQLEARRPLYRRQRLTGVFEGPRVVGTLRSWNLTLTVPGGAVAANAISSVTVAPTHRRRGLLSAMLTADLARAAAHGTPVAILIASEAPIYGRFGFGPATEAATWTVNATAARFRREPEPGCRTELVPETDLREEAPTVYEAARRPGAIDRDPHWWNDALGVAETPGDPRAVHHAVLVRDAAGEVQRFLHYRPEERWEEREYRSVVHVEDLHARTPDAYAALWRYLVDLDTVATVRAADHAVDEPLPWLLTDARAARQTARADFEWTRLLDPAAALSARRYDVPGRAVIEVVDPAGWATGTFLLDADADGTGMCTPTTAAPDLTLGVDTLSALWLGGGDLAAAALSGRAHPHRPEALPRIAALLRTARAPWTSTWF